MEFDFRDFPELVSERLLLRSLQPTDANEIFALRSDEKVNQYIDRQRAKTIEDAGQFAFTLEGGGGVRIATSTRRAVTIGVRLHHISNGDTSGSNRGLNQFVIYAGFSVFK